jgi:transposase
MRSEYIVHLQEASVIQLRQEWFRQYHLLGNARETCTRFGISRKTFYKWLKRFNNSGGNPSSLADLPRTPHHSPRRTSDDIRALVLEMRNTTGFGPRRLGKELRQQKGIQLSERTIWKIIRSGSPTNGAPDNLGTYSAMGAMNQVSVGV